MEQANEALQANGAGNDTPKTYNVKVGIDANGNPIMQEVDENELLNGYLRQRDYTIKTQELAEERKLISQKAGQAQDAGYRGDPSDDEAVEKYLQSKGYAKADYVEQLVEKKIQGMGKIQQDEATLQSLISTNPELKQFEGAIRKIAATDNSAIEDIVVKYGFSNHDKLSKAKQRDIVGGADKFKSDTPKPYGEWTKEEKDAFRKQYGNKSFR